jgi:hypothetical protein
MDASDPTRDEIIASGLQDRLNKGIKGFRREIKTLGVLLTVVIVLMSGLAVVALDTRHDLQVKFDQALTGLCTFRSDLQVRVQNSRDFLKQHPNGIPGIPASVLKNSIDNQRLTLSSLKTLPCAGVETKPPPAIER